MLAIVDNQPQVLDAQGAAASTSSTTARRWSSGAPASTCARPRSAPTSSKAPQGARPPRRGDRHASAPAATPARRSERLMSELRALRGAGAGDPRDAPAAPDRPRARQGGRGVPRADGDRSSGCARSSAPTRWCSTRSRSELLRAPRGLRRRAPHRDRRRGGRHHHRGHDRRRGHGGHGHRTGYIKRSPLTAYRAQQRGGKGRIGMPTKDDDFVEHLFVASAHSYILVFTESGRVHWLKVHEMPPSRAGGAGQGDRQPAAARRPTRRWRRRSRCASSATTASLLFATERGMVKKTELSAYGNPRAGGIIAINIDEGDRLLAGAASPTPGHDVLLATARGPRHPLPGERRAADGPRHPRRARHQPAQGRPRGGDGGARPARRTAPIVTAQAASASAPRSPSTASRGAAARASSTSRSPARPARWSPSSRSPTATGWC